MLSTFKNGSRRGPCFPWVLTHINSLAVHQLGCLVKENLAYIHNGVLAIKKNKVMSFSGK